MIHKTIKRWNYKGMDCIIKFVSLDPDAVGGWYCGYVGVPDTHPFYNQDYNEYKLSGGLPGSVDIDVHGGVTFSGFLDGLSKEYWYIGFDCNHYGDTDLKIINHNGKRTVIFISLVKESYVVKEVKNLVKQISRWIQWF